MIRLIQASSRAVFGNRSGKPCNPVTKQLVIHRFLACFIFTLTIVEMVLKVQTLSVIVCSSNIS